MEWTDEYNPRHYYDRTMTNPRTYVMRMVIKAQVAVNRVNNRVAAKLYGSLSDDYFGRHRERSQ